MPNVVSEMGPGVTNGSPAYYWKLNEKKTDSVGIWHITNTH